MTNKDYAIACQPWKNRIYVRRDASRLRETSPMLEAHKTLESIPGGYEAALMAAMKHYTGETDVDETFKD